MKSRSVSLLLIMPLFAGCAAKGAPVLSAPSAPASVGRMLAYGAGAAGKLSYHFADTTISDIQAGPAGTIRVNITNRGVAELLIERSGSDLKVGITLVEFSGTFTNSAGGGTVTANAADMKGPAQLILSPRGVVTVTQRPELTQSFRAVSGSDNIFRRFFVRVPARLVAPGTSWTDTLTLEESTDGLTSRLRNIVESTYARDTVVLGRTLQVITGSGHRALDVMGTSQGVEIVQKLTGKTTSITLWDAQLGAAVFRDESATLNGTFDLPGMNLTNLPIHASGRSIIQLRGN